jgi:hypothetical protein
MLNEVKMSPLQDNDNQIVLQPLTELVGVEDRDLMEESIYGLLTPLIDPLGNYLGHVWKDDNLRSAQLLSLQNEECFNC